MVEYEFTKKDWALFREKVADWQEDYMDKLNKEYIDLLMALEDLLKNSGR